MEVCANLHFPSKITVSQRKNALRIRRNENEKNLPTQEKTKKQSSRFQSKNEDNRRKTCFGKKKKQGSPLSLRIVEDNKLEVCL